MCSKVYWRNRSMYTTMSSEGIVSERKLLLGCLRSGLWGSNNLKPSPPNVRLVRLIRRDWPHLTWHSWELNGTLNSPISVCAKFVWK